MIILQRTQKMVVCSSISPDDRNLTAGKKCLRVLRTNIHVYHRQIVDPSQNGHDKNTNVHKCKIIKLRRTQKTVVCPCLTPINRNLTTGKEFLRVFWTNILARLRQIVNLSRIGQDESANAYERKMIILRKTQNIVVCSSITPINPILTARKEFLCVLCTNIHAHFYQIVCDGTAQERKMIESQITQDGNLSKHNTHYSQSDGRRKISHFWQIADPSRIG